MKLDKKEQGTRIEAGVITETKAWIYSLVFRTGHFYIGSSKHPERRYKEHQRKPANRKLKNWWIKFGDPVMHILVECNLSEQKKAEQLILDLAFGDSICKSLLLNTNPSATKPYFGRWYRPKGRPKGKTSKTKKI